MKRYEFERMDFSSNYKEMKVMLNNYFSELAAKYEDDKSSFNPMIAKTFLKDLIMTNGLWWSSSIDKDFSKVVKHLENKFPLTYENLGRIPGVLYSFLVSVYNNNKKQVAAQLKAQGKDHDKPAKAPVNSVTHKIKFGSGHMEVDDNDYKYMKNESESKNGRIRAMSGKYPPAVIARIMGVTPQRVRNALKSS